MSVLLDRFHQLYRTTPRLFRAPGRVNLIGEHTDYNDGFVLPMAIDREIVVAAAARSDHKVRVHSLNFNESLEFDIDEPGPRSRGIWLDYVEGVARALADAGCRLTGADMALSGTISMGGGLSSSAALEISVGSALLALSGAGLDKKALALAGQKAEHTYVGTKCGIMDQFVAAMGKRGCALLIDCRALEGRLIPLNLHDSVIVISDTRVKHSLASSQYNSRRAECERGVELLRQKIPGISALRDVSLADFEAHQDGVPEPVRRRCRHVISENGRTLAAAGALEAGNISLVGRLMNESHDSLRRDYEVSCSELDLLVDIARSVPGVAGTRMTGGGFGGCTVSLVAKQSVRPFEEAVAKEYGRITGLAPHLFEVEASDGASEIMWSEPQRS
jgi:galactokinase